MQCDSLKTYIGIIEVSAQGVPHFHGYGIADRRRKTIKTGKLTVIIKKIGNIIAYSKYMVKDSPTLMLVDKVPYHYDGSSFIPMKYTKKTIINWLNPVPQIWT